MRTLKFILFACIVMMCYSCTPEEIDENQEQEETRTTENSNEEEEDSVTIGFDVEGFERDTVINLTMCF